MGQSNLYSEEELKWLKERPERVGRLTPSQVNELAEGEVFVFGSNFHGQHHGGAARAAVKRFGAIWGIGEGLQGQSYAIPTMEGLGNIPPAVDRFTSFARQHREMTFFVTAIGCGIAGYSPEEIAPLFVAASRLDNVRLPLSFLEIIEELEELIKCCKYYGGENSNPYDLIKPQDNNNSLLWFYDSCWVRFMRTNRTEISRLLEDYEHFGPKDFMCDDGVPQSLKALLFNRYAHWCGGWGNDAEGFMAWYAKEY